MQFFLKWEQKGICHFVKDRLHSKSHNTPFDGAQLFGKVCATIKGGKLNYQAED